ncbi:hypothetical protein NE237_008275 [Protea cynaroides]|uniref:Transmembrane protein n=1 Tax=Protea cynaroides TaxID=273540 RepID=A0A9Q0JR19_9MAGN|nr:hypothetical protein NE237_008275 [Protea cynaroides]
MRAYSKHHLLVKMRRQGGKCCSIVSLITTFLVVAVFLSLPLETTANYYYPSPPPPLKGTRSVRRRNNHGPNPFRSPLSRIRGNRSPLAFYLEDFLAPPLPSLSCDDSVGDLDLGLDLTVPHQLPQAHPKSGTPPSARTPLSPPAAASPLSVLSLSLPASVLSLSLPASVLSQTILHNSHRFYPFHRFYSGHLRRSPLRPPSYHYHQWT